MTQRATDPISTLADHIAGRLSESGGDLLFGLPGGGNNLEVIGAAQRRGMRFVLAHTEFAASVMAAVYGQLVGRVTGCVVTRGPGAASALNGLAQAFLDRQPLVLISDSVSVSDRGRVPHQQLDQQAMFAPVVKRSIALGVEDVDSPALASALALAMTRPVGPVHIDVDVDAVSAEHADSRSEPLVAEGSAEEPAAYLAKSVRPCVLLGMGALDAVAGIRAFVRGVNLPVLATYRAQGVIPDSWPQYAGTLTGASSEADVLGSADLIIAIGVDQVELIPNDWPFDAPVISLAGWAERHTYFAPALELRGEIAESLAALSLPTSTGWISEVGRTRLAAIRQALLSDAGPRSPQRIIEAARSAAPKGTIATVDAGAHMLAALAIWATDEPQELLISTGLATMGFALPAAIAAALATPEAHIVCFVGDGGLSMVEAELETVGRLGLPITVVLFNDSTLSLIAMKQRPEGHGGTDATEYARTDFAGIAVAHGIEGMTVDADVDLDRLFRARLASKDPALIDIAVNSEDYRQIMAVTRGAPAAGPDLLSSSTANL
jgi:acetolactate synthase-1/2/3 large subunit